MSLLYRPSATHLIVLASLGFATVLTGCSSEPVSGTLAARFIHPHLDTDWRTTSSYASAIQTQAPHSALRTAHAHPCAACGVYAPSMQAHTVRHRSM